LRLTIPPASVEASESLPTTSLVGLAKPIERMDDVMVDMTALTSSESNRRRRLWRITLSIVAGLLLVLLVAGTKAYVFPNEDRTDNADAIIVLGGFGTKPIDEAFDLARAGVADTVVLSDPYDPNTEIARAACAEQHGFEVICFRPSPNTTQGEAREIRSLMHERDWSDVVVVTATYHVTRARIIIERCQSEGVHFVAARTPTRPYDWAYNYLYQTAGLIKLAVTSGC
jgi:uncharacterized SAM-binding protein YcdF (DUF218 family)